jgi:hypothetical protein
MIENQQPGEPVAWEAYEYAARLAQHIHDTHYPDGSPEWKPLPDLMGVLSQIDNALTGLTLAHPRPRVGVTEAMVEAFLSAYAKCELYNGWTFTHRMGVRAGIRAALADSPAPPANGGGEVARG